jgi:hypothetical protein
MESTKYIGMDVHKDAISIAVLHAGRYSSDQLHLLAESQL